MSNTKTIDVIIAGTELGVLMNRFHEGAEGGLAAKTRTVKIEGSGKTPREMADPSAYRIKETQQLYLPGTAIMRLLRESGSNHKIKGSRKSVKFVVPSAVIVYTDAMLLTDEHGKPLTDFEVDSRPVRIPATGGVVMKHRPRIDRWRASFRISVDEGILEASFVQQLLTEGGQRLGIGDFRPEKGGPFGRFRVISWDESEGLPSAAAAE